MNLNYLSLYFEGLILGRFGLSSTYRFDRRKLLL